MFDRHLTEIRREGLKGLKIYSSRLYASYPLAIVLNMANDSGHYIDKNQGWLLPNNSVQAFRAGIYLVATPIGNLRDITLRALDVLAAADLVACEDTRVSGKLLKAYGISKKLVSYNDHSDESRRRHLLEAAKEQVVALISDAGMPLISDPGYKLVREALACGVHVSSMPGANAPLMALQLSGVPSDCFSFIGFLPSKQAARLDVLREWSNVQTSLIAFESASRLLKALVDIEEVFAGREVVVARELTKMYEETRRGPACELISIYESEGLPKGEIVLVISPPDPAAYTQEVLEGMLKGALESMGTKEAAKSIAEKTGLSKKDLYAMALEIKGAGNG